MILDPRNGTVVADIQANDIPPDEFTELSIKLLGMFNNPEWAIEDNGVGNTALTVARQLRYPRIYARKPSPHSSKRVQGWRTDGFTRDNMWNELIALIRRRGLVVPSKRGLAQFFSVVVKTLKTGSSRYEAQYGAHDDYPTAVAIAWQIRGAAGGSGGKVVTLSSRVGSL